MSSSQSLPRQKRPSSCRSSRFETQTTATQTTQSLHRKNVIIQFLGRFSECRNFLFHLLSNETRVFLKGLTQLLR